MDESKKGKTYPPLEYEVGREKIREYANAVGEHNPVHHDREAAQAAGFRDVVAPPMFAVVYSAGGGGARRSSTRRWASTSRACSTAARSSSGASRSAPATRSPHQATLENLYERAGMEFYVFESVSKNQDGAEVARGTWTNIVRGG